MAVRARKFNCPILQIVGPTDNWVLEHLARRLAAKIPYGEFVPWRPQANSESRLVYYVNYALYQGATGLIDVALFTHYDETQQFLERARGVDYCVSMSQMYAGFLRNHGVATVVHIPMGFDAYRYRPRLILGVVGRLDHPRKGRQLVEELRKLTFVEVLTTEGKIQEDQLIDFYRGLDYVLIPALVEGGPLSLLEGLALGKPIIAPEDVGMVPEFEQSSHIRRYPAGNLESLIQIVTTCFQEKLERFRLVHERTWDKWAEGHHELFCRLLRDRNLAVPHPAPGFRFGLLGELDIPWGVRAEALEAATDRAATYLFYGRYDEARSALEEVVPQYPFAQKLLDGIPSSDKPIPAAKDLPTIPHLQPLR